MSTLNDLPAELLAQIADHCDDTTLIAFRSVSRRYNQDLWHSFAYRFIEAFSLHFAPGPVRRTLKILEQSSAGHATKALTLHEEAARLLAAVPNLEVLRVDHDEDPILGTLEGEYCTPTMVQALLEKPRHALRELKLENMVLSLPDLKRVCSLHKDTLRSLELASIRIRHGTLQGMLEFPCWRLELDTLIIDRIYPDADEVGAYELLPAEVVPAHEGDWGWTGEESGAWFEMGEYGGRMHGNEGIERGIAAIVKWRNVLW